MLVLHANWTGRALCFWAESLQSFLAGPGNAPLPHERNDCPSPPALEPAGAEVALLAPPAAHWFACRGDRVAGALGGMLDGPLGPRLRGADTGTLRLRLPAGADGPCPSDRLAAAAGATERALAGALASFQVPCLIIEPDGVLPLLMALESLTPGALLEYGHELRYWFEVGRFVAELLEQQRFIPSLVQAGGGLEATWQPWIHDEDARFRVGRLVTAMPPLARAVEDDHEGRPWPILHEVIETLTDAAVRQTLLDESYADAIANRDARADEHVAWLSGLLGRERPVRLPAEGTARLLRRVGDWVNRLDEGRGAQPWRLCLRLEEPAEAAHLADLEPPPVDCIWRLSLHLCGADDPRRRLEAARIWAGARSTAAGASSLDRPHEILLKELARASRVYPPLEAALATAEPTALDLSTEQAYAFLVEDRPLLEESGFIVLAPEWWDSPATRLGARLHVDSPPAAPGGVPTSAASQLGLRTLVHFQWQVAVGEDVLEPEEFDRLLRHTAPLVRVRGRWVRLQREQVEAARRFMAESGEGQMTLLEAIQVGHGMSGRSPGLPVLGLDPSGWVADLLRTRGEGQPLLPDVEQPAGFHGSLRPYQRIGLSWLVFLDELGLGACLADDMGLGKTIQLIALLVHEREQAGERTIGPTLLVVPTSLIGNWSRELGRFAPSLSVHVHHGPDRPAGDRFAALATGCDVVISTYGLVSRDRETLGRVAWHRVALDEAQFIKNPPTKQTSAIRELGAARRVALTGTPVENRLSELWSIMEFCNPGYLGPAAEFRRRLAVPIERYRDRQRMDVLRRLIMPFVLRRLKTDPKVIDDLPPCVETREYATLTPMQAALYQEAVGYMMTQIDRSEGMQRRGLVLATLVRLKQICDHPALIEAPDDAAPLPDGPGVPGAAADVAPALAGRSGKARRLVSLLEEVLAGGERALVFTQFRRMGHLLTAIIEHELDCETLYLHGGTPPPKRQQIIDRFQDERGGPPVFVLSLRAGGIGLNLTAATHVFHYDRWWNPAVENQATDRAFRIGQTRRVHVHKFVCVGTLEERIDQMIEAKTELAETIVGSGEDWLTEMSTLQLRDVLALRQTAMEMDS